MNELIREFAKQTSYIWHASGEPLIYEFTPEKLEKFAELIVQECVEEMTEQMYLHHIHTDQSNNPNFYKAVEKTLKHFGVE